MKETHMAAKEAFETACAEELAGCGWTGPREKPEAPILAVKSGAMREAREKDGEMKAVRQCMLQGVDLGTTGDLCLAAMSDLEGLSKPHKGKELEGKGRKEQWAGLTEEEIALKKEEMAAAKLEMEALKEEVVGLKEGMKVACAAEFAACHADVGYDLSAEDRAALSQDERAALRETMHAAKECMSTVFDSASEECVAAKTELDTAVAAAKEGHFGRGKDPRGEGRRGGRAAKEAVKAAKKAVKTAAKTAAKAASKLEAKALKAASQPGRRAKGSKPAKGGRKN
jgi:hypothetical protein